MAERAERFVWVSSGRTPEKGAFAFPIDSSSNRLIVDGIASYFGLDPTSLTIGRMVLLKDANGHSVMDTNEIRQASTSAGLGDGMSEHTPIIITGASASHSDGSGVTQAFDTVLSSLYQAFNKKRKKQAFDEVKRDEALNDAFYQGNGIYSYTMGLVHTMSQPEHIELVGKKVSKFVGSVHIIARTRQQKIGVATIVKPNGVCLTAEECIGKDNGKEVVVMVTFPRLGGGVCYECRVASRENAIAVLEPVQTQSFDACMLVDERALYPATEALTFDSFATLGVVRALVIDYLVGNETGPETIILPVATVTQIGMPVFCRLGSLQGVVVQADGGKLPRQPSRRKLKSLHGIELNVQCVGDLDKQLKVDPMRESGNEFMSRAILQNQLVECTFLQNFKGPIQEWEEQHPLESFPLSGSITPLRKPSLQSILKPISKEEYDDLFSEITVVDY